MLSDNYQPGGIASFFLTGKTPDPKKNSPTITLDQKKKSSSSTPDLKKKSSSSTPDLKKKSSSSTPGQKKNSSSSTPDQKKKSSSKRSSLNELFETSPVQQSAPQKQPGQLHDTSPSKTTKKTKQILTKGDDKTVVKKKLSVTDVPDTSTSNEQFNNKKAKKRKSDALDSSSIQINKPRKPNNTQNKSNNEMKMKLLMKLAKRNVELEKKKAPKPEAQVSITGIPESHGSSEQPDEETALRAKKERKRNLRTLFVGNLPNTIQKKTIKSLFKPFGDIESIQLRCAAPADPKLSQKATIILKKFHPKRHNINAFVIFKERSSAKKAVELNGSEVEGFHIRVDRVLGRDKHDHVHSVFVGNLPFGVEEDPLRSHFIDCGDIINVRIIRDRKTGVGKGFGYVLFKDNDAVDFALKLDESKFEKRKLRVRRSTTDPQPEGKKAIQQLNINNKRKHNDHDGQPPLKRKKSNLPDRKEDYQGFRAGLHKQQERHRKKEKRRQERKKKLGIANMLASSSGKSGHDKDKAPAAKVKGYDKKSSKEKTKQTAAQKPQRKSEMIAKRKNEKGAKGKGSFERKKTVHASKVKKGKTFKRS